MSGQQVIEPPAPPPPPRMTKIGRSPLPNGGEQTLPQQAALRRDWKGVIPKRPPLEGNVYFPGAGMDPDGKYTPDMRAALREFGMANVRVADRTKWSKGFVKDVLDVRNKRNRDDVASDFSAFKRGAGQLNLIGHSYGALQAAQAAADLADQGRKVDHLVLIGAPITQGFLDQLKSNPNIGKVIVVDLTKHGDKIYAGMLPQDMASAGLQDVVDDLPSGGPLFSRRGVEFGARGLRFDSHSEDNTKGGITGHFY